MRGALQVRRSNRGYCKFW